ncbi:uncharacterized protein LOC106159000 [Lingula anatina]|uniref:Uncharacterized protein LOC106159000 n=1 Tax=Lingula anatina TaxID=7574 RepID=A0A1S3HX71_LINAN|nr:uncharacterized protein LOC106159000 [Lingula anatina]XP_013390607.1 uncharacterized protein LOC106159000 [Lingula anatina]XP_013390608.1 uncharacterized protein LOC106159000 [Lingula anatina]|eukprot:XP_013390606.1 uncharacterized protein LOC106159000 [Lingula anatina]
MTGGRELRELLDGKNDNWRENLDDPAWSEWLPAMIPSTLRAWFPMTEDNLIYHTLWEEEELRQRPNYKSYYCDSVRESLRGKRCGIFELGIKIGDTYAAVYLGSTLRHPKRNYTDALRHRIEEFLQNSKNPKAKEIEAALSSQFALYVRYKEIKKPEGDVTTNKDENTWAENAENDLLDSYDYAWNVRRNGKNESRVISELQKTKC